VNWLRPVITTRTGKEKKSEISNLIKGSVLGVMEQSIQEVPWRARLVRFLPLLAATAVPI